MDKKELLGYLEFLYRSHVKRGNIEFQPSKQAYEELRRLIESSGDKTVINLVKEQAKDIGLWFIAKTTPEAYLQKELRRLHSAIEERELA